MAERPNAPVLKTGDPRGSGGSNPSASAAVTSVNAFRVEPVQAHASARVSCSVSFAAPGVPATALPFHVTVRQVVG